MRVLQRGGQGGALRPPLRRGTRRFFFDWGTAETGPRGAGAEGGFLHPLLRAVGKKSLLSKTALDLGRNRVIIIEMKLIPTKRFFKTASVSLLVLSSASIALSLSYKPEEIALNLEKKLRSLQTIQADFEQLHFSMSVSEPLREKGKFFFKKPDWMRWEYKDPEEKVFLYKEGVYQFYIPEENQLIRSASSRERLESEVLSIFSGKQNFADRYIIEASPFPTENKASLQIKLTPKEEGEYSHILIEVNPKTWLIDRAIFFEWAGNKLEFRFSRVKTGGRLSPEVFELKVPPDCEIIEEADAVKK